MSDRLERLRAIARARTAGDAAHDFSHVARVASHVRQIAAQENARVDVAVAAALLHELVNLPKDHPESSRSGELCADEAARVLAAEAWPRDDAARVAECIRVHAFSRGLAAPTPEARALQDADRLDAIGAIGVARCFATCGAMRAALYEPDDPFARSGRALDDRRFAIDHFYRKLLELADGMHTETGRALAAPRAAFLREFLAQLERELG